jgi:hypothetical protein
MEGTDMTTRIKDFGGDDGLRDEPIVFRLYDNEFECRPEIPGALLLKFFKEASDVASIDSILTFLENALMPDDWPRFQSLINDPDRVVRLDRLGEIVSWLIEQYAGETVPTKPSRQSTPGRSRRGSGSTVSSSDAA